MPRRKPGIETFLPKECACHLASKTVTLVLPVLASYGIGRMNTMFLPTVHSSHRSYPSKKNPACWSVVSRRVGVWFGSGSVRLSRLCEGRWSRRGELCTAQQRGRWLLQALPKKKEASVYCMKKCKLSQWRIKKFQVAVVATRRKRRKKKKRRGRLKHVLTSSTSAPLLLLEMSMKVHHIFCLPHVCSDSSATILGAKKKVFHDWPQSEFRAIVLACFDVRE